MKRVLLLTVIIFVCGTYKSFGQFNNMSELYQWLNQSNQQSQQMMNQMMEMYGKALSESQRQLNESVENAKKAEVKRLAALKVVDDESYFFKDTKTGKYGGVISLNSNIGINNGFNPVKVFYRKPDGDTKVYITDKCLYVNDMIIVSAMFTLDMFKTYNAIKYFNIVIESEVDYHGSLFIPDSKDAEAIKNYDKYNSLMTALYNAMVASSGISMPSSAGSSSGSSSGSTTTTYVETCSRCGGTGEVLGSAAIPNYTSDLKWCSKCSQNVLYSHYHETCPSCGGTGKKTRTR